MGAYRFALSGVTLPGADDLFGVWEVPFDAAHDVPFDPAELDASSASAPAAPAGPVWRAQLPAVLDEAQAILEAQRLALQRSESDLIALQGRLARLDQGVSFGAPTGPEAELWAALNALESPVSFGLGWREDTEKQEIHRDWQGLLDQISHTVSRYARVETEVGARLVGYTTVSWTGDFDTIWKPGVTSHFMQLHHQTLHLALASRLALLRLLIVVGSGVANLTLRLTVPGAQLLLLPAVWKFVRDVLKELRQSRLAAQKT